MVQQRFLIGKGGLFAGFLVAILLACGGGGSSSGGSDVPNTPSIVAPSITTQPLSLTVTAGQTATFSVVATGTAPLTYQWKKNSTNISSATSSSYTTGVTSAADDGSTFTVSVSNAKSSVASQAATLTVTAASAIDSIEFGRTLWGTDDCLRADIPAGGTLFSVWTKIPDPGSSYPWTRGNMDVYLPCGDNWYFRCLVGNSSASSPASAFYNANSMLFANPGGTWVNDYSYYQPNPGVDPLTDAQVRGWVWVAWQLIVNSDSFVIRQWLKFGVDGTAFAAGESTITFAEARTALVSERGWTQAQADAWVPGPATHFQVGKDNGYLCHARMASLSTAPTLADLEAIARTNAADTSAWADYELNWVSGAPDLSDRSGHGRDLSLETGGTLYKGLPGPSF